MFIYMFITDGAAEHVDSDEYSDNDKYATARGTLTLHSYSDGVANSEPTCNSQTHHAVQDQTIPEGKLYVDMTSGFRQVTPPVCI